MDYEGSPTLVNNQHKHKSFKKVLAVLFLILVFYGGWQLGRSGKPIKVGGLTLLESHRENAPKEADWNLLWDAIKIINERYVNRPADLKKILEGAVQGAVSSLGDPYSVFFPPQEAKDFADELHGNIEGIGAEIGLKHQQLTVITPLDESPAIKAGIRSGDYIYKVDGEETTGLTVEQAVSKIRGPAGTKVTLTVLHNGDTKPIEIVIQREKIEVKSVTAQIREINGKKIGHVAEVHPGHARAFGIRSRVAIISIDFDAMREGATSLQRYIAPPQLPPTKRDIAVVVDETVLYADLVKVIRSSSKLLTYVELFDIYRGSEIGSGQKSLAFHLTYSSAERTLTDIEVDDEEEKIWQNLEVKFKAHRRT